MDASKFPWPNHVDDEAAERWRGPLFTEVGNWSPKSVTFPICWACGHIVWDWAYYQETPPELVYCTQCYHDEHGE